jgi:hypothetical protein
MTDERSGTVFIGENFDLDEPYLLTGRFTAHWEGEDVSEHMDGPEGVPVEEAIAWGRERADVVLIRLGDSDVHYSAGRLQPPPEPDDEEDLPVWPEGRQVARRRLPGKEHLDLVTDEPIAWTVRLPRRVSARTPERDVERLRQALDAEEAVSSLRAELEAGDDRVDAVLCFQVEARSHDEAMRLVFAIEERTLDRVPLSVDPVGWDPMNGIRPAASGGEGRVSDRLSRRPS